MQFKPMTSVIPVQHSTNYMIFVYLQSFIYHSEGLLGNNMMTSSQWALNVSSVGEVLHQYHDGGGHGFKSCMGLNFFQALFWYYLSSVYNCEDCFDIHFFNCSSHI